MVACLSVGMAAGLLVGQGGNNGDTSEGSILREMRIASSHYEMGQEVSVLRQRGTVLDESPPTPVSPQGRTPTPAAEVAPDLGEYDEGVARTYGYTALGSVVAQYPWPINEAFRIVDCETGGTWNPLAVGALGERGLFQIHPIHFWRFDADRLFDPEYNTWAAYQLYREGGWTPWSCA